MNDEPSTTGGGEVRRARRDKESCSAGANGVQFTSALRSQSARAPFGGWLENFFASRSACRMIAAGARCNREEHATVVDRIVAGSTNESQW